LFGQTQGESAMVPMLPEWKQSAMESIAKSRKSGMQRLIPDEFRKIFPF
jgi:hypothetical protein